MILLINLKIYKNKAFSTKWKKGAFNTKYIKKTKKRNNGKH